MLEAKWLVVVKTEKTDKVLRVLRYKTEMVAARIAYELNRSNQDHTWNRATAHVEYDNGQVYPGVMEGY